MPLRTKNNAFIYSILCDARAVSCFKIMHFFFFKEILDFIDKDQKNKVLIL
jgi:hypothetical protein